MPKKIGNLTLYSVDDLHNQLGLSKMTIRTYLREGRIKGRKLGVSWYVTEDALRSYFEEAGSSQEPKENPRQQKKRKPEFKYVVQGINDLVSEEIEADTVDEAIDAIGAQKIISLFQVAVIDKKTDEVLELVKARDFLERHQ